MPDTRPRRPITAMVTALTASALLLVPHADAQPASATSSAPAQPPNGPLVVYRVAHAAASPNQLLDHGFDVVEQRQGDDLFVLGNAATGDRLRQAGFEALVDHAVRSPRWTPPAPRADNTVQRPGDVDETYYGGYHTVNAQYAHLDQVARQHGDLATVVTYGQSWRKQRGLPGGYDLRAICISRQGDGVCRRDPKAARPRFFLAAQIHAREITTGDVAWRWIDELVGKYGTDSAITSLVDSTVHTGNDAALRALARHMGQITGHRSGQAGEILYNASGGTDDWTLRQTRGRQLHHRDRRP